MQLQATIQLGHKLADMAGLIILRHFRQPYLPSATKDQISSIVTIADQQAEKAMVELILKESPGDGIIREEGEHIPSQTGRTWVLDPLDGTAAFVRGIPTFGTLISLVDMETNTVLWGIVNQPVLQQRWLGINGVGSWLNEQPIFNPYASNENISLQESCLISTTPLMFITQQEKAVAHKLQKFCRRTAFGGDCYNYVALATGWSAMPMIILEADMQYYDFCALIPILQGTGTVITDWQGNPLKPDSTQVLATVNQFLLAQVLAALWSGTFNGF